MVYRPGQLYVPVILNTKQIKNFAELSSIFPEVFHSLMGRIRRRRISRKIDGQYASLCIKLIPRRAVASIFNARNYRKIRKIMLSVSDEVLCDDEGVGPDVPVVVRSAVDSPVCEAWNIFGKWPTVITIKDATPGQFSKAPGKIGYRNIIAFGIQAFLQANIATMMGASIYAHPTIPEIIGNT